MEAKLLYWAGAFVNLALIVTLALRGLRQVRRGDVAAHRRSMLAGALLVGAFLVSYVLKLIWLGREDLSLWSRFHVYNLRFHETCILLMLLAGGLALTRARAMRGRRQRTRDPADSLAPASTVRWHRNAGRTAVLASIVALLTAAAILAGMIGRA